MTAGSRWRPWIVGAVLTVGAFLFTTGPLYRIRSWWSFSDPLSADVAVVLVQSALAAVAAAALASGRRWRRLDRRIVVLAGAWVGWTVLSTAWSSAPATTAREALLIGATLVCGAAAVTVAGEELLMVAGWLGVHLGLAWSAIAIAVVAPGTQDYNGDWTGIYFNANSLALVAAFGILLSVVLATRHAVVRPRGLALVVLALAVLADGWLVMGTGAVTPLLAVAVSLALGALALAGRRVTGRPADGRIEASVVAAAGGAGIVALTSLAWVTRDAWLSVVGKTGDLTGRTALWEVSIDWVGRRPVAGYGYLASWTDPAFLADIVAARGRLLGSAHNSFVEILLGTGVIGLGLVVVLMISVWMRVATRSLSGRELFDLWPLVLFGFVVVENLTETLFVAGHLTVLVLGVVAAASPSPEAVDPAPAVTDVVEVQSRR